MTIRAVNSLAAVAKSASRVRVGPKQALPPASSQLYKQRGAHYSAGTTTFTVFAPNAKAIWLVLTSTTNGETPIQMHKTEDGLWQTSTNRAPPGQTYLYRVEDCDGKNMLRTDPLSFAAQHIAKYNRLESVVVDHGAYQWQDEAWLAARAGQNPLRHPLSIYEVQLKSWKTGYNVPKSCQDIAQELVAYCKKMNFTHVELYGLLDHQRGSEHGYQISHFFAPYHKLGTLDDVKYLINVLHQNGIGVILDWVMTHLDHKNKYINYSSSIYKFDGTDQVAGEKTTWETLYFDYTKEETKRFMKANALYWLNELHVDGLRFDAVTQMISRDGKNFEQASDFLKDLTETIHQDYPGVLVMAEDTGGFQHITKPLADGGLGFDLKWGVGWCYDSKSYFHLPAALRTQKIHHAAMLHLLSKELLSEKLILSHSHDDSDVGSLANEKTLYSYIDPTADEIKRFANLRNFFCWQILGPSRGHLLHMGDELGQSESWYRRLQKKISAVNWELEKEHLPSKLQQCVSDLNRLYKTHAAFWEKGEEGFGLLYEKAPQGLIAYYREDQQGHRVFVIHNFSDTAISDIDRSFLIDKNRQQIQKMRTIFNSNQKSYGGSGGYKTIESDPRSLSIAPQSTLVLEAQID